MNITVKDLLDAGVHFGHQLRRYNPKSKKFVYDHRHGISIIDLEKTYECLARACNFVEDIVGAGKQILLVGTKRQSQELIREASSATNMPFCTTRWMGGTLTNNVTIKKSIDKYKKYLAMELDGSLAKLYKKEQSAIRREMERMRRNFEGIVDMIGMPGAMFVVDIKHEAIAVAEANRLSIPVVALVDTNSDPTLTQYPIPGNDDSIKSVRVIVQTLTEAIQHGLARRESAPSMKQNLLAVQREANITEEQLPSMPARGRGRGAAEGGDQEEIPTTFSTDAEEAPPPPPVDIVRRPRRSALVTA